MKVNRCYNADRHGHVHEWSKCGLDKLGCLSCCVQVHMCRQSLTIINFTVLVRSLLYCAFSVYSTQTAYHVGLHHSFLISRAQNTRRHAAFCRAAAVTCREALKMCGRCAARLAAMP